MKNIFSQLKRMSAQMTIVPIFIVYFVIAAFVVPSFFTGTNISNILAQSADMLILSMAMMMVILNGGIDFSLASVTALGSVLGAKIMNQTDGLLKGSPAAALAGVAVMIGVGLAIGIFNGFAVTRLRMPSFMATMASYLAINGISLYLVNSKAISGLPSQFLFIGNGKVGPVPFNIILAAILLAAMWVVLNKTVYGRYIYAVGTNPKAAEISGIPVKKVVFSLFVICSVLGALGGLISTARLGAAMPELNQDRQMDFVTAVILGGTSIFGGKGTLAGTIIGAFFIVVLNNSLGLLGLSWYTILMIKGIFLIAIISLDSMMSRKIG